LFVSDRQIATKAQGTVKQPASKLVTTDLVYIFLFSLPLLENARR